MPSSKSPWSSCPASVSTDISYSVTECEQIEDTFHDGRLLGLFLSNSKTLEHYHFKGIFDFSRKYDDENGT